MKKKAAGNSPRSSKRSPTDSSAPTSPPFDITVIGLPIPQGSKTAYPFKRKDGTTGVAITEGKRNATLKDWRASIAAEARRFFEKYGQREPIDGPVFMRVLFYLPRPKSAPKRVQFPATKPDLDKLLRAVKDALSKIVYTDDARIITLWVDKRFAVDSPPRAFISIHEAGDYDLDYWNDL